MSEGQKFLVLDTNVWLDAFLPGRERRESAQDCIQTTLATGYKLLYPIHILPDIFYLTYTGVKRYLRERYPGHDELCANTARSTAWDVVGRIRKVARAVEAGEGDAWMACGQEHLHNDLEDNLVLAAALRTNASYLITSDTQLCAHAPLIKVRAITPEEMVKILQRDKALQQEVA